MALDEPRFSHQNLNTLYEKTGIEIATARAVTNLSGECSSGRVNYPQVISEEVRSVKEMEVAGVLCSLPQTLSRTCSAFSRQGSTEATPKGLQDNKTNIGPSKCHKRTRSKVHDALQKEVRNQLHLGDAETMWNVDDPIEMPILANASPVQKEAQLPFRSWATAKVPVVVPGAEHNKRKALESYVSAPELAALYLRRNGSSKAGAGAGKRPLGKDETWVFVSGVRDTSSPDFCDV